MPIHETGYHWFRINDETGYHQFRSIVGANSRNWVSSVQKYCGCRFMKTGYHRFRINDETGYHWFRINDETGYHQFRRFAASEKASVQAGAGKGQIQNWG